MSRKRDTLAEEFNVSKTKVKNAIELLSKNPLAADEVRNGQLKLNKALAAEKRREQLALIANTPPPVGKYRTIVIDPPWLYDRSMAHGGAGHHYEGMSFERLAELPIKSLCADDASVFLWATSPFLPVAFDLLRVWGLQYRQELVWRKTPGMGMGSDYRVDTEPVLLAERYEVETESVLFSKKGRFPMKTRGLRNFFEAPRGRHSEKPDRFFTEVVEPGSHGPYLEMFARKRRPGWTTWGAELPPEPEAEPASAGGRAPAIHQTGSVIKPSDDDATE